MSRFISDLVFFFAKYEKGKAPKNPFHTYKKSPYRLISYCFGYKLASGVKYSFPLQMSLAYAYRKRQEDTELSRTIIKIEMNYDFSTAVVDPLNVEVLGSIEMTLLKNI